MTNEEWNVLVEEFDDEAYKCVFNTRFSDAAVANQDVLAFHQLSDMILKPISVLIEHDIEFYGDNAYQMWEVHYNNISCEHLQDIYENLHSNTYLYEHAKMGSLRRKASAALPFNLKRAMLGDTVECNIYTSEWCTLKSFELVQESNMVYGHYGVDAQHGYDYFDETTLRMKYPERLNKGDNKCMK